MEKEVQDLIWLLNAGAALYISNKVESLSEGMKNKSELHSGRPLLLLNIR